MIPRHPTGGPIGPRRDLPDPQQPSYTTGGPDSAEIARALQQMQIETGQTQANIDDLLRRTRGALLTAAGAGLIHREEVENYLRDDSPSMALAAHRRLREVQQNPQFAAHAYRTEERQRSAQLDYFNRVIAPSLGAEQWSGEQAYRWSRGGQAWEVQNVNILGKQYMQLMGRDPRDDSPLWRNLLSVDAPSREGDVGMLRINDIQMRVPMVIGAGGNLTRSPASSAQQQRQFGRMYGEGINPIERIMEQRRLGMTLDDEADIWSNRQMAAAEGVGIQSRLLNMLGLPERTYIDPRSAAAPTKLAKGKAYDNPFLQSLADQGTEMMVGRQWLTQQGLFTRNPQSPHMIDLMSAGDVPGYYFERGNLITGVPNDPAKVIKRMQLGAMQETVMTDIGRRSFDPIGTSVSNLQAQSERYESFFSLGGNIFQGPGQGWVNTARVGNVARRAFQDVRRQYSLPENFSDWSGLEQQLQQQRGQVFRQGEMMNIGGMQQDLSRSWWEASYDAYQIDRENRRVYLDTRLRGTQIAEKGLATKAYMANVNLGREGLGRYEMVEELSGDPNQFMAKVFGTMAPEHLATLLNRQTQGSEFGVSGNRLTRGGQAVQYGPEIMPLLQQTFAQQMLPKMLTTEQFTGTISREAMEQYFGRNQEETAGIIRQLGHLLPGEQEDLISRTRSSLVGAPELLPGGQQYRATVNIPGMRMTGETLADILGLQGEARQGVQWGAGMAFRPALTNVSRGGKLGMEARMMMNIFSGISPQENPFNTDYSRGLQSTMIDVTRASWASRGMANAPTNTLNFGDVTSEQARQYFNLYSAERREGMTEAEDYNLKLQALKQTFGEDKFFALTQGDKTTYLPPAGSMERFSVESDEGREVGFSRRYLDIAHQALGARFGNNEPSIWGRQEESYLNALQQITEGGETKAAVLGAGRTRTVQNTAYTSDAALTPGYVVKTLRELTGQWMAGAQESGVIEDIQAEAARYGQPELSTRDIRRAIAQNVMAHEQETGVAGVGQHVRNPQSDMPKQMSKLSGFITERKAREMGLTVKPQRGQAVVSPHETTYAEGDTDQDVAMDYLTDKWEKSVQGDYVNGWNVREAIQRRMKFTPVSKISDPQTIVKGAQTAVGSDFSSYLEDTLAGKGNAEMGAAGLYGSFMGWFSKKVNQVYTPEMMAEGTSRILDWHKSNMGILYNWGRLAQSGNLTPEQLQSFSKVVAGTYQQAQDIKQLSPGAQKLMDYTRASMVTGAWGAGAEERVPLTGSGTQKSGAGFTNIEGFGRGFIGAFAEMGEISPEVAAQMIVPKELQGELLEQVTGQIAAFRGSGGNANALAQQIHDTIVERGGQPYLAQESLAAMYAAQPAMKGVTDEPGRNAFYTPTGDIDVKSTEIMRGLATKYGIPAEAMTALSSGRGLEDEEFAMALRAMPAGSLYGEQISGVRASLGLTPASPEEYIKWRAERRATWQERTQAKIERLGQGGQPPAPSSAPVSTTPPQRDWLRGAFSPSMLYDAYSKTGRPYEKAILGAIGELPPLEGQALMAGTAAHKTLEQDRVLAEKLLQGQIVASEGNIGEQFFGTGGSIRGQVEGVSIQGRPDVVYTSDRGDRIGDFKLVNSTDLSPEQETAYRAQLESYASLMRQSPMGGEAITGADLVLIGKGAKTAGGTYQEIFERARASGLSEEQAHAQASQQYLQGVAAMPDFGGVVSRRSYDLGPGGEVSTQTKAHLSKLRTAQQAIQDVAGGSMIRGKGALQHVLPLLAEKARAEPGGIHAQTLAMLGQSGGGLPPIGAGGGGQPPVGGGPMAFPTEFPEGWEMPVTDRQTHELLQDIQQRGIKTRQAMTPLKQEDVWRADELQGMLEQGMGGGTAFEELLSLSQKETLTPEEGERVKAIFSAMSEMGGLVGRADVEMGKEEELKRRQREGLIGPDVELSRGTVFGQQISAKYGSYEGVGVRRERPTWATGSAGMVAKFFAPGSEEGQALIERAARAVVGGKLEKTGDKYGRRSLREGMETLQNEYYEKWQQAMTSEDYQTAATLGKEYRAQVKALRGGFGQQTLDIEANLAQEDRMSRAAMGTPFAGRARSARTDIKAIDVAQEVDALGESLVNLQKTLKDTGSQSDDLSERQAKNISKIAERAEALRQAMPEAEGLVAEQGAAAPMWAKALVAQQESGAYEQVMGQVQGFLGAEGVSGKTRLERARLKVRTIEAEEEEVMPGFRDRLAPFLMGGRSGRRARAEGRLEGWYGEEGSAERMAWNVGGTLAGVGTRMVKSYWEFEQLNRMLTQPYNQAADVYRQQMQQQIGAVGQFVPGVGGNLAMGVSQYTRFDAAQQRAQFSMGRAAAQTWGPVMEALWGASGGITSQIGAIGAPAIAAGVGATTVAGPIAGVAAGIGTAILGTIGSGSDALANLARRASYLRGGSDVIAQGAFGLQRIFDPQKWEAETRRGQALNTQIQQLTDGQFGGFQPMAAQGIAPAAIIEGAEEFTKRPGMTDMPGDMAKKLFAQSVGIWGANISGKQREQAIWQMSDLQMRGMDAEGLTGLGMAMQGWAGGIGTATYALATGRTLAGDRAQQALISPYAGQLTDLVTQQTMGGLKPLDLNRFTQFVQRGSALGVGQFMSTERMRGQVGQQFGARITDQWAAQLAPLQGVAGQERTFNALMGRSEAYGAYAQQLEGAGFRDTNRSLAARMFAGPGAEYTSGQVEQATSYMRATGLDMLVKPRRAIQLTKELVGLGARGIDVEGFAQGLARTRGVNLNDPTAMAGVRDEVSENIARRVAEWQRQNPNATNEERQRFINSIQAATVAQTYQGQAAEIGRQGGLATPRLGDFMGRSPEQAEGMLRAFQQRAGFAQTGYQPIVSGAYGAFQSGNLAMGNQLMQQEGMVNQYFQNAAPYGRTSAFTRARLGEMANMGDRQQFDLMMRAAQGDKLAMSRYQGGPAWMYQVQEGMGGGSLGMQAGYDQRLGAVPGLQASIRQADIMTGGYAQRYGAIAGMDVSGMNTLETQNAMRGIEFEQWNRQRAMQRNELAVRRATMVGGGSITTGVTTGGNVGDLSKEAGLDQFFVTLADGTKKTIAQTLQTIKGGQWGIEDSQRALGLQQQQFGLWAEGQQLGLSQARFALSGQQWEERFGLRQRQTSTQLQWQEADLTRGQRIARTQAQWGLEDIYTQRGRTELSFGWQMEDYDRNVRYARGRERLDLLRQRERTVIGHSLDIAQSGREEDRAKQRIKWQEEEAQRDRQRFEQNRRWTMESIELDRRQFQQERQLQQRELELQALQHNKRIEWTMQEWNLETQLLAMRRAQALVEQKQSENMLAINQRLEAQMQALAAQAAAIQQRNQLANARSSIEAQQGTIVNYMSSGIGSNVVTSSRTSGLTSQRVITQYWGGGFTGDMYDDGGFTGGGGKYESAGTVHRGEYVIPAAGAPIVRGDNPQTVALLKEMKDYMRRMAEKDFIANVMLSGGKSTVNGDESSSRLNIRDRAYARR